MLAHDPSHDPNCTADYGALPAIPDTVDFSPSEHSTDATPLQRSQSPEELSPAEAPAIPGYRITKRIAKGGMDCVYGGIDGVLDREVAIKTLLPGADAVRFVTEAKINARYPHPNIPPVYALGTLDNGTPWLAMKWIRGQTLADLLANRQSRFQGEEPHGETADPRQRLAASDDSRHRCDDLPRFIQIFEQICQAVGFAHAQGIIHCDLKPLNVMVGEFGEVQVMDWGLAKDLSGRQRQSRGGGSMEPATPVTGGTR